MKFNKPIYVGMAVLDTFKITYVQSMGSYARFIWC
jgi:hypothetical protein